jgi:cobalamin biosynthesis protein CbiG
MMRFYSGGTRILWFNPIGVVCSRSVNLEDVERSLQRSLNELRRRIHEESLGSYITH